MYKIDYELTREDMRGVYCFENNCKYFSKKKNAKQFMKDWVEQQYVEFTRLRNANKDITTTKTSIYVSIKFKVGDPGYVGGMDEEWIIYTTLTKIKCEDK